MSSARSSHRIRSRTRLTYRGVFLLIIAITLNLAGFILMDGVHITLACCAFALLLCCYILGKMNLAWLSLELRVPEKIHAARNYELSLKIKNPRTLLDAFRVQLRLSLPFQRPLGAHTSWIPAASSSEASLSFSIPIRTFSREHPAVINSLFPLALFHFSQRHLIPQPLCVYPRAIDPETLIFKGKMGNGSSATSTSPQQHTGDFGSLRNWQSGDAAKHIHWQASIRELAKQGHLVVKEPTPSARYQPHTHLIFHTLTAERSLFREDHFEKAISLLVGTIDHLRRLGTSISVHYYDSQWIKHDIQSTKDYYQLLEALARYATPPITEIDELQHCIDSILPEHSLIIASHFPVEAWLGKLKLPTRCLAMDSTSLHYAHQQTLSGNTKKEAAHP